MGQSGTSESHQYYMFHRVSRSGDLNYKTGDKIKIDLNKRRVDVLISNLEFKIEDRKKNKPLITKLHGKNYQD